MDLLIVGASARAAAWSARRAGHTPMAADLYGDRDLAAVARSVRVGREAYPGGLIEAARGFPACPWIYTGALENRPDLVEAMARERPLLGNDGATLRRVRDPSLVFEVLRGEGLPAAEVRRESRGLPRDGSWLRKPRASAGGYGIAPLVEGADAAPGPATYYQRRVEGANVSALFVGYRDGVRVAGVTGQWIGREGFPFAYRGSVAPWAVGESVEAGIRRIGEVIGERFGLRGIFGVDLVVTAEGVPIAVEVNPRYTASVEVVEWATGRSLLAEHVRACEGREAGDEAAWEAGRFVAKEVVFATAAGRVGRIEVGTWADVPEAADVPEEGSRFEAGEPVLTVFAQGEGLAEAVGRLRERREEWKERFFASGSGPRQPSFPGSADGERFGPDVRRP